MLYRSLICLFSFSNWYIH